MLNHIKKPKIIISWSSGKDSAYALYKLLQNPDYEVVGLLTTVTAEYNRVSMHAVREELLELQARRLNLPLYKVMIPKVCSDAIYKIEMAEMITKLEALDIAHIAFGDLFLEDIKQYREQQLAQTNIKPLFPLWQKNTTELAEEIIKTGFKAIVTCIDPKQLAADFIGQEYNMEFINKLPKSVDPCGENGEFHSFIYETPNFSAPIDLIQGDVVEREGFVFIDLNL